jgi:hypothetical protein
MQKLLPMLVLAGCASAASSPGESARQPVILTTDQGVIQGERPQATELTMAASPVIVWSITKRVYQGLDIPVTVENPAAHQIGNPDFWKTRAVGQMRMGQLVNCGIGMTGPKADSYRIYMSLLTTVDPDGKGGTRLRTLLVAFGQDVAGGSTDRIPCGTTGVLESAMNEAIRNALGRKS